MLKEAEDRQGLHGCKISQLQTLMLKHTFGCGILVTLDLLGELVLMAGLRRSMSSAVSCCWIGLAKDTRLDYKSTTKKKLQIFQANVHLKYILPKCVHHSL